MKIEFTLNGKAVSVNASGGCRASTLLSEEFKLHSFRCYCNEGWCGRCIAIVDNLPHALCLLSAYGLRGQEVVTAEGIEGKDETKALQNLFNSVSGCYFCRQCLHPRLLLAYHAVCIGNEKIDTNMIQRLQREVTCRCGAYPAEAQSLIDGFKEIRRRSR